MSLLEVLITVLKQKEIRLSNLEIKVVFKTKISLLLDILITSLDIVVCVLHYSIQVRKTSSLNVGLIYIVDNKKYFVFFHCFIFPMENFHFRL